MAKESLNIGQWINQHIDLILDYRGKCIALSVKKGIISADEDYNKMKSGIKKQKKTILFGL